MAASSFPHQSLLGKDIQRESYPSSRDEYMKNRGFPTSNELKYVQEDVLLKKYIGNGVTLVNLVTENLLNHPFQVLRRQCQVNHSSQRYHLIPLTFIPTLYNLHHYQGLSILWKGLGSALLVRGISLGVEDLISKTTSCPKEMSLNSSIKEVFYHTLLKCASLAIVTPFFCASFVETVQSEVASDKPQMFDVFREGFTRLICWNDGYKGRMLPIWILIVPTVTIGLARYIFSSMIKGASVRILHAKYKNKFEVSGALPKDLSSKAVLQDLTVSASYISNIITDITFYPCDTIIHRLYLQGTRTIIDNLDNGQSVLPILTNYTGTMNCLETCLSTEGKLGLYKGFGALILQYAVHITIIQLARYVFTKIGALIRKPKNDFNQVALSPAAISDISGTYGSYLLP